MAERVPRMNKKLLFINNTMGLGGAEVALIELIKKLDSMGGYDIYLYLIIPCGEILDRLPQSIKILNKSVSNCPIASFRGRCITVKTIISSFFYRFTGFRLLGYIRQNLKDQRKSGRLQYDKLLWRILAEGHRPIKGDFDLAVAYIEGAATYSLAKRVDANHKASFVHIDYVKAGYTPFMDQGAYREMERIFVVSNEVGKKFLEIYPQHKEKVYLFRNLLDRQTIIEKAKSENVFTDDFRGIRLVTMGRLHYQKGYDIAIGALALLKKEGYNIRWYILGEGGERKNLESLIESLGLKENFLLMGSVKNPYPYVAGAYIYVHGTRFEGKSIAVEEAQILGKAIVASDCTGNSEQIESGYDGVLFTLNEENMAREIKNLIDNPEIREKYERNVLEKKLDFPEDMEALLGFIDV